MNSEPSANPARESPRIIQVAKCIVALQETPQTLKALRRSTGGAPECIRRVVNQLLEAKLVEFKGWGEKPKTGPMPAIYGWKR